ncbi:MAG: UMP kinase, partial [Candidatus ainarchaeum sp.]|nr:UMP kinase [Candidatus ainarchaeum sp.]
RQGSEYEADEAAIKATKENAKEVIKILGKNAYPKVPKDFNEAKKALEKYKFVVMGGMLPGITTDSDAVLLAECVESEKVINISNIDGVYDKNPKEYNDAKKYHFLTHDELLKLAFENDKRIAGTNFVFDILACKLAARSKIEVHFVSGKKIEEVEKAVEGKDHSGTIVK